MKSPAPDFGRPLAREFYAGRADEVAPKLLGQWLVRRAAGEILAAIIVETEVYVTGDQASHAYRGVTVRNRSMWDRPGTAYVYQTRRHYCLNATCRPQGVGEAVLIRAVEPRRGVEAMKSRRPVDRERDLCSGPAKLCQAFGVDKGFDGIDLTTTDADLWIAENLAENLAESLGPVRVAVRIGISKDKERPLRFFLAGSETVSRR